MTDTGLAAASVYEKLRDLIGEVDAVEQRGHNSHQDYDYMTAEDLLRAVRDKLAAKGLTLVPSLTGISERQVQTRSGESTITTAHIRFTVADEHASIATDWAGQGQDPGDKGLGKAFTNALKTYLRSLLLIPQGQEDPEADPQTDIAAQERVASPPPGVGAEGPDDEQTLRDLCAVHITKIKESSPEVWERVTSWADERQIDLDNPPADKVRALERALRRKAEEATK